MVDANHAIALERACTELDPSWIVRREDLDSEGSKDYSTDLGDGWEAVALDGEDGCRVSLRLRGGCIEASLPEVRTVEVSRRYGMSAESWSVGLKARLDGWGFDPDDPDGWTMPIQGTASGTPSCGCCSSATGRP